MSRLAQQSSLTRVVFAVATILLLVFGVTGAVDVYHDNHKVTVVATSSQTTDIKYQGEEGEDALTLLQKYAVVETKHYSFGDMVTSINNTEGTGPKYWSFYVNGKLSAIGASDYVTKDGDRLEWKLQQL